MSSFHILFVLRFRQMFRKLSAPTRDDAGVWLMGQEPYPHKDF